VFSLGVEEFALCNIRCEHTIPASLYADDMSINKHIPSTGLVLDNTEM